MNFGLLTFLILFSEGVFAQNIIDNPGFESGLNSWNTILTVDNYSGVTGCQEGQVFPASGTSCVGVRIYHETIWDDERNWQEYILQSVNNEMHQDTVYKVSLKYRLADRCTTSTDALGVGFLNIQSTDMEGAVRTFIQSKTADVRNPPGQWITNTTQYQELTGYYRAKGDEFYVAIGAFQMDSQMTRVSNGIYSSYPLKEILYFFDDVKVAPCSNYPQEPFSENEYYSCESQAIHLDASTTAATYLWSDGSTGPTLDVLAQNQTVWVEITRNGCVRRDEVKLSVFSGGVDLGADRKVCSSDAFPIALSVNAYPGEHILWNDHVAGKNFMVGEEGTYWVVKSLNGCMSSDTVTITNLGSSAHLFPNPVKDHFAFTHAEEAAILSIQTEDGKWIFKGVASAGSMEEVVGSLTPAVYFIQAEVDGCILNERIVKMND